MVEKFKIVNTSILSEIINKQNVYKLQRFFPFSNQREREKERRMISTIF